MEQEEKKSPKLKNGAQGLLFIGNSERILDQRIVLIQDFDDRKRGDNLKKLGLPGGTIEEGETPIQAVIRELFEEINFRHGSIEQFGCYQKIRNNNLMNDNYLFVIRLNYFSKLITNDLLEVSNIHILKFREIIDLYKKDCVHEGSIRLICRFLKGQRGGLLNDPVVFMNKVF